MQVFRPETGSPSTMNSVFARAGLRTLNLTVLFFAALGFCFVPLGQHTGWEHTKAILATQAAAEARSEVAIAFGRLRDAVLKAWREEASGLPQSQSVPAAPPFAVPMSRLSAGVASQAPAVPMFRLSPDVPPQASAVPMSRLSAGVAPQASAVPMSRLSAGVASQASAVPMSRLSAGVASRASAVPTSRVLRPAFSGVPTSE